MRTPSWWESTINAIDECVWFADSYGVATDSEHVRVLGISVISCDIALQQIKGYPLFLMIISSVTTGIRA